MSVILLIALLAAAGDVRVNAVCSGKTDLAVLLDSSTSVCGGQELCQNWMDLLQFGHKIVKGMTIGSDDSRVALVTIHGWVHFEWDFNKYLDKTPLLSAIDNLPFVGADNNRRGVSRYIIETVFSPEAGDRPNVTNVALLITDGFFASATIRYVSEVARSFEENGIKVFVVCVTKNCNPSLAQALSAPPTKIDETYWVLENYGSLDFIGEAVLKQICAA